MAIDAGTVILGMILDTLTGRSPLYRLEEFFEHQDTELLLGKKTDPLQFSDYTVGRVLDRIYDYGTMKLFSQIAMQALTTFRIDRRHLSFDTTSVSVQGDYAQYSSENSNDDVIKIVYPIFLNFPIKMV